MKQKVVLKVVVTMMVAGFFVTFSVRKNHMIRKASEKKENRLACPPRPNI